MSTSASNEITMAKDVSPYTFSEATNLHIITQAVGSWTAQNLGKKWFILAANYGFGWQTTEGFRRIGKQFGCTELGLINHPTGATDYTTYFPKILAANPEVLLLCNFGKDQLNSVKQAHEFGLKKKMKIVAPLLVITSRMAAGDEPYEEMIGGATFYWGMEKMIPTAKAFVTNYRKKWGRPPTDMSGYGSTDHTPTQQWRQTWVDNQGGYFALTGAHIFDGRTTVEVCAKHLHETPEPPSRRIGLRLPGDLESVLFDCLAKQPGQRPTTAGDLCRHLEACRSFGQWTWRWRIGRPGRRSGRVRLDAAWA